MHEICIDCPLDGHLFKLKPDTYYGELPKNPTSCIHYSCVMGIRAARIALSEALKTKSLKQLTLYDGTEVNAVRFGTNGPGGKPTHIDNGKHERWVTEFGDIISRSRDGDYIPTTQNIHERETQRRAFR